MVGFNGGGGKGVLAGILASPMHARQLY